MLDPPAAELPGGVRPASANDDTGSPGRPPQFFRRTSNHSYAVSLPHHDLTSAGADFRISSFRGFLSRKLPEDAVQIGEEAHRASDRLRGGRDHPKLDSRRVEVRLEKAGEHRDRRMRLTSLAHVQQDD